MRGMKSGPIDKRKPNKMRPLPALFALFLIIPLVEIWFLIEVGSVVGVGWTILLVVSTAVAGAGLIRFQGFSTFLRVRQKLQQEQIPAFELAEGLALLIAGALMLTPGFFTDGFGFLILIPPLRRKMIRYAFSQMGDGPRPPDSGSESSDHHTLQGEWRHIDD